MPLKHGRIDFIGRDLFFLQSIVSDISSLAMMTSCRPPVGVGGSGTGIDAIRSVGEHARPLRTMTMLHR